MASTVIDPVADVLVAKAEAISITGYDVKAYKWARASIDKRPAAIVGVPRVQRTNPTDPEPELRSAGSNSVGLWTLTFPVTFYVDLTRPPENAALMVEIVERFIESIDIDPTLGGLSGVGNVGEPRCTDGEPNLDHAEDKKPMLAFDFEVVVPRMHIPS